MKFNYEKNLLIKQEKIYPTKIDIGDEIRVIAPSQSMSVVGKENAENVCNYFKTCGYNMTFSEHSWDVDDFSSSSYEDRAADINNAFEDEHVKMIIAAIGGFNCNQVLPYINYEVIANNPKYVCGFSDNTALLNAIYARTGLVTFHGPDLNYLVNADWYTRKMFFGCFSKNSYTYIDLLSENNNCCIIQEGQCQGEIVGGSLCTFNLLKGTPFFPSLKNKILFIEDDNIVGDYFLLEFQRNLISLFQVFGADGVRGIVFGRFDESCGIGPENAKKILCSVIPSNIPILFGADFGHVDSVVTFPIGGRARLYAYDQKVSLIVENY